MDEWQFRCYLDEDGVDVIDDWIRAQPDAFQGQIETRLRFLRQQPRDYWVRPLFDTLGAECSGLGELRLKYKNVQWRIIGFASGQMEFTWIFVAQEKGNRFVPKNTCDIAQRRKAIVTADRSRSRACEFD